MDADIEREIIRELHQAADIYANCMISLAAEQLEQSFQKLERPKA